MKKKILFSIALIFAMCFFAIGVNAAITKLSIPNSTKAKAPETVPTPFDVVYGSLTEEFDFSKIKFSSANGGADIDGYDGFRKIILGKLKDFDSTDGLTLDSTYSNWFTAYCLDNLMKFPELGLLNNGHYANASTDDLKLIDIIITALSNDSNVQAAVKAKSSLKNQIVTSIDLVSLDGSEVFYELTGSDTASSIISNVESLNIPITIKIKKIEFHYLSDLLATVTAEDITGNTGDTSYDLTFTGKDILFDKYNVTESKSVPHYDHALWIIEHSYPTMALKESVEFAGADYDGLRKEICELEGHTFDDTALTCNGFADLDDYVENYVYATVQYAIWKATDHTVLGDEIGDTIVNSDELNQLYQFLLMDRSEYDGYSSRSFTNKIKITKPKEEYNKGKSKGSYDVFGPYTAKADVLSGGKMTVTIANADTTGIRVIDENGKSISKLSNGQKFYVECKKDAKIGSVSLRIKLKDASIFDPLTNRGRIYKPQFSLLQNLMSGGKIINKDIEADLDIVTNANTGVENVAILLMVTLVAFTLAYLVLSYKQKSVQLN